MSQETEWFQDQDDEQGRKTVSPYWLLAFVIFVVGTVLYAAKVSADPIAQAQGENGAVITLFNEPCDIKEQVTNLPMRAQWVEGQKTFKGCWGARPDLGSALFYFDDKTVGVIPFQALRRVVGA